jgi:hypothetical protein
MNQRRGRTLLEPWMTAAAEQQAPTRFRTRDGDRGNSRTRPDKLTDLRYGWARVLGPGRTELEGAG